MMFKSSYRLLIVSLSLVIPLAAKEPASYDIVVYGGTSGGVISAVQSARSGKTVVLVSPTEYLGGLTTSGLGWTDLGENSILGGISREFYQRIYQHYENGDAWNWQARSRFGNHGQGTRAFNSKTKIASVFEPKVATKVFQDFIREEKIPVVTGRLDLKSGVIMKSGRIDRIRLEDGREFAGKMFIDATYEGDLLPGAGVAFTIGREPNSLHGETYSGIQTARATKNQLVDGVDPYIIPGDPSSGLLDGVEADSTGEDGDGDGRLQAFCFRMVLTDVAENRVSIAKPDGYQEKDYELLFRSLEAGQKSGFFKFDLMPNRKTDSNNSGGISTDYIGKNYGPDWNWATLNHDQRLALAKQHENWQRGLVWTLQNHPRVPESIRKSYGKWGLPADEFTDNAHWPHQLYVREARRMISDYVMNQYHCSGAIVAPDSVGLAAYAMDSHHVRRHVVNGMVKNEGDVQMPVAKAYPISYRSIIPNREQCANLLVPWSLSSTHMAFGSIRMEPVFMILGQSAAIAANIAIDEELSVQDVSYSKLRPALLDAGQALGNSQPDVPEFLIDESNTTLVKFTGNWQLASSSTGFIGSGYLHDDNKQQGRNAVFYRIHPSAEARQKVFLRWTSHPNRASNVTIQIRHRDGVFTQRVNQRNGGNKWNPLGDFFFSGADNEGLTILTKGANGHVIADAVGLSGVPTRE